MTERIFDGFTKGSDESVIQFLNTLFNSDNIELKTEITNPFAVATLRSIASYLEKEMGLDDCSDILSDWIIDYMKCMVSYQRKGRLEGIDGVKGLVEMSKRLKERLTGNLKESGV
jgi:hypothetical protein